MATAADTTQANAALVRELYAALDRGDDRAVRACFAPGFVHHAGGSQQTLDEVLQTSGLARVAFPDYSVRVAETIAEDERVMVRHVNTGTHTGEVFGIAPTGRAVSWQGINVMVVRDGRIVEDTPYWDFGVIFRQLGVDPSDYGF